jgi:sodium/proline symporter
MPVRSESETMPDTNLVTLTFIGYILLMLVIGLVAYRRTADLSDYLLGGRQLGRWVTALSAEASDMSGWLLLGLPGYAYLSGLEAGWIALGLLVGTYFNWKLVASRLRVYSELAGDALTLPEFLEQRFADHSRVLRVVAALFVLLFFTFYTSSGLVASGKLFESVFGIDYRSAVLVGALVVVAYTFLGGFLAVSWTDLVQGCLMFVALLAVPMAVLETQGGVQTSVTALRDANPALLDPLSDRAGAPLSLAAVTSLLGWGLGYFGQPHILARFMAIRQARDIESARAIAVTWVAVTLLCSVLVGVAAVGYLPTPLTGSDSEKVFIEMVAALFHPLLAGICLAAILAAIMSTADSQLLVASAALSDDFYKGLLRPQAGAAELVWMGRLAVLGLAALAIFLAMDPERKVLELVAYAWAGFGAAFGPTILLSLYWRRMNRNGALAGILTGGITVIWWGQLQGGTFGLFDLYEIIPGFGFSTLAILLVSLATAPPEARIQQQFENLFGQPAV